MIAFDDVWTHIAGDKAQNNALRDARAKEKAKERRKRGKDPILAQEREREKAEQAADAPGCEARSARPCPP